MWKSMCIAFDRAGRDDLGGRQKNGRPGRRPSGAFRGGSVLREDRIGGLRRAFALSTAFEDGGPESSMQPIAYERETLVERRQSYFKWGSVIAGIVVALASWLTLQLIGTGIGLASVDVDDAGSVRAAGIGTGVWSLIVPMISLFIGGFVATRLSHTWTRGSAAAHAVILWAFTAVLGAYFMLSAVGAILGTTVHAATVIGAASARTVADHASAVSYDDMVGPINDRLRAQGKPTITSEQLENVIRATARHTMRDGRLDRDAAADELARDTALSRAEADDVVAQLDQRWNDERELVRDQAVRTTQDAADTAGKTLAGAGASLLLGFGAALCGALFGAYRVKRENEPHRVRVRTEPSMVVPPPPPTGMVPPPTGMVPPQNPPGVL
jgi:hypothetical protein